MKKFIILLFLLPNLVFSQDFYSKFMKLKEELAYVDSLKLKIKSISIAPNGDWVVVYGDFGFSYNNLPAAAKTYLNKQNSEKSTIKDFDFLSDTAWVCIAKHNAYALKYVQKDLGDKIKELNQKGSAIYQVAVLDNKWAIIYDKGQVVSANLTSDANQKIKELQSQNRLIKNISLFESTGWLLLYGKNEYASKDIPLEVENELKDLKTKDVEINFVVFFNRAWIIIYNDHSFKCNF